MFKYIYILTFLTSSLFASKIMEDTVNQINEFYPNNINIEHKLYKLTKEDKKSQNIVRQKYFRKELNVWRIQLNDSTYHYAILDNVKGKSMPITFLTIFNEEKKLSNAAVIKYREAYGGEVGRQSWLTQFNEYTDESNYKVGDGVSGISGATISVYSMSKGIHKLSIIIDSVIGSYNES